jgi:hypothetical protein
MSGNSLGSWYATCSFPVRNGVFYVGGTAPSVTLSKSGATAYEVRDYWGSIVSSGSVSGTTCTPTAPTGGWVPGWYRVYFTGPSSDATNGNAYAATMFSVIRNDSHFPAMPASTTVGFFGGEFAEPVAKGIMGLGHSRHVIASYTTPTVDPNGDTLATVQSQVVASKTYWSQPGAPYADASRPRPLWVSTPGSCADCLTIGGSSGGTYLRVYAKTASVDSSQVYVATSAGSSSGSKVQVYSPNSSTLVETFDNLASSAAAATAINAGSAYIRVYSGGQTTAATTSATVIGRTIWNNIVTVVTALYPDIDRYEFTNEPTLNDEVAHQMRLFQGAVHAGNAGAKAIGPAPVDISNLTGANSWTTFLAAGGGSWCDEISFHDYNSMTNGNIAQGRSQITAFQALLAQYGQSGKALWQTEAGGAFTAVYGVHHPRRARVKILHTLLWEQYGVPRERNPMWYDASHGFWAFPMPWQWGDRSVTPDAPLHRVLAEETWGKPFASMLDLGVIGQRVALASLYTGTAGQVVVACATSTLPGATITYSTSATGSLTAVDAFGNTSTVTVTDGLVTVPLAEIPTYLRLPVGATVSAYRISDWPPVAQAPAWRSSGVVGNVVASSSLVRTSVVTDDALWTSYGTNAGTYAGTYSLPDTLAVAWPTASRMDRVIIWCGPAWQTNHALVDFDVQTSNDGTTWTTQATVTKTTPSSFLFGTDSSNTWCVRETFWDEQWVFDVPLPAPVTTKYLRLNVRATSYGGEPDAAANTAGGQGDSAQRVVIQEIAILCDDNTRPQYVRA